MLDCSSCRWKNAKPSQSPKHSLWVGGPHVCTSPNADTPLICVFESAMQNDSNPNARVSMVHMFVTSCLLLTDRMRSRQQNGIVVSTDLLSHGTLDLIHIGRVVAGILTTRHTSNVGVAMVLDFVDLDASIVVLKLQTGLFASTHPFCSFGPGALSTVSQALIAPCQLLLSDLKDASFIVEAGDSCFEILDIFDRAREYCAFVLVGIGRDHLSKVLDAFVNDFPSSSFNCMAC